MRKTQLSRKPSGPSLTERFFAAIWIYALFLSAYTIANRTIAIDSAVDLTMPPDLLIPFIPEFIYPFYLLYGFIVLPSFLIKDRGLFYRTASAFSALIVLSVIIFIFFPVVVPRPDFVPGSFSGRLVSCVYQMDRPLCGFPSLHVSASLLATLAVFRNNRTQGVLFLVLFILTSAATLFIKQHVVLDAAGGIAMALLMDFIFLRDKKPSLRSLFRAVHFLLATSGKPGKKVPSDRVRRVECVTGNGTRYDLYEPLRPAGKTFIVIHGLTLQGEKDERLMDFSEKMAVFGIRTAAISLPALRQCRFDVADIRAISDLALELSGRYEHKLGIIGFSFGAGLALVAAAGQQISHLIDPMILFGPYYSLKRVQTETERAMLRPPAGEAEWNNYIWLRLVNVYRHPDKPALDADVRQKIDDMLTHYCHEPSLAVKRDFFEKTLRPIRLDNNAAGTVSDAVDVALSPENKLQHIQSRVFLIHDYHDTLIHAHHSQDIFNELKGHGAPNGHKLLVTPLLSHVTPGTALKLFDVFPLINIFAGIFE